MQLQLLYYIRGMNLTMTDFDMYVAIDIKIEQTESYYTAYLCMCPIINY